MDLSKLEEKVLDNPEGVVSELKDIKGLNGVQERLLARACIRAKYFRFLIDRLKNNGQYRDDAGVLNFYVRALQAENEWREIASLKALLIESNNSNALSLMKACLRTADYATVLDVFDKFQFNGEDKIRSAFAVFQATVKKGDFQKALTYLPLFEHSENENIFKWHLLSENELKQLKPFENGWVAFALSRELFKKRKYINVISVLKPFVEKPLPSDLTNNYIFRYYCESLCNVVNSNVLINELSTVLSYAEKIPSLSSFVSLYSGQLSHIQGNFEHAVNSFNKAEESIYALPSDKGACTVKSAEQIDKMETKEHDEINFDESNTHKKSDVVTVVASDSKYFLLFFDIYQKSFKANNADYLLHFHIVNPDADVKAKIENYQRDNGGVNFSYSNAESTKNIKAFYASIRFLIAKQLLNYYECPLLITDIDAGFTGKLLDFNFEKQGSDISFKLRSDSNLFPWRLIPAGTVIINNTEGAARFLDCFSSYFYTIYAEGEGNDIWWVDQSALYSLYRYFEGRGLVHFNNLYESSDIDSLLMFPRPLETKQKFIERVFSE